MKMTRTSISTALPRVSEMTSPGRRAETFIFSPLTV